MKVVILCGGQGTRLREETEFRPKPLVDVGSRPILWHIMKMYAHYGFRDFVLCLGYRGHMIKEYFANYALYNSDVTFDMARGEMSVHQNTSEPWRVTLVDTGLYTATGGRLRRVRRYLENEELFFFTYGDGVADVDVGALAAFHRRHGALATMTTIQPPSRFANV